MHGLDCISDLDAPKDCPLVAQWQGIGARRGAMASLMGVGGETCSGLQANEVGSGSRPTWVWRDVPFLGGSTVCLDSDSLSLGALF